MPRVHSAAVPIPSSGSRRSIPKNDKTLGDCPSEAVIPWCGINRRGYDPIESLLFVERVICAPKQAIVVGIRFSQFLCNGIVALYHGFLSGSLVESFVVLVVIFVVILVVVVLVLPDDFPLDVNVGIRKGPIQGPVIDGIVQPLHRKVQGFPQIHHKQKQKGNQNGQKGIGGKDFQKGPAHLGQKDGSKGQFVGAVWLLLLVLGGAVAVNVHVQGQDVGGCRQEKFGGHPKKIGWNALEVLWQKVANVGDNDPSCGVFPNHRQVVVVIQQVGDSHQNRQESERDIVIIISVVGRMPRAILVDPLEGSGATRLPRRLRGRGCSWHQIFRE